MKKYITYIFFLWIFIPSVLYCIEAYLQKPDVYLADNERELVIVVQLRNGLDLDRMAIIEKGISVKLIYEITIYKKNHIFVPDEKVIINPKSKNPQKKYVITNELTYNYITRSYIIKTTKNYPSSTTIKKLYAGINLKESYRILKEKYFEKQLKLYARIRKLQLKTDQPYYVKVECTFKAVKTIYGPIKNKINFTTSTIESKVFKIDEL